jgi:AcrR family transcriptional regulator
MPKSSVYVLFGSKEELQLATVDAARASFVEEVVSPALHSGRPGRERLAALCEWFLGYVERRVFPGGCFFVATAAELGARPGIPASCPPGPTRRSWPSSCRPFWPAGLSPRGWVPELSGVASVANWT